MYALITQKDANLINNYDKFLIARYYLGHIFKDKVDIIVHGFINMAAQFRRSAKVIIDIWSKFAEENRELLDKWIKEEE